MRTVFFISLTGNPGAGKTTLVHKLRASGYPVGWWCIKEHWYIPQNIMIDGQMDWVKFRKRMPMMRRHLFNSIRDALPAPAFIIEHAGPGKWLNNLIKQIGQRWEVVDIHLSPRLVGSDEPDPYWRKESYREDGQTCDDAFNHILAAITSWQRRTNA